MRSEEPAVTMEETGGPDAAAGRLGAPYSEAWGVNTALNKQGKLIYNRETS